MGSLFFASFMIIFNIILINLLIAIVWEGYSKVKVNFTNK